MHPLTTKRATLVTAAAVTAYLTLCTLQVYRISASVGLDISPWTVFLTTVKLMATAGPWVPFLMHPPSGTG